MEIFKDKNYISIVTIIDHQSNDVTNFISTLLPFCQNYFEAYEFIFVDNNAKESVLKTINEHFTNSATNASLVILPYEVNKEQAALSGIDASIGDFVFVFDNTVVDYTSADLQRMYQDCLSGNDIVLLKPSQKQSFVIRLFYKMLVSLASKNSALAPSTAHLVSRRAINRVNYNNTAIHYRKYAYCNCGLNYHYLDYIPTQKNKKAQVTFAKVDFATDLLLLFTNIGKRITLFFNIFFFCISLFMLCYTLLMYSTRHVVSGWTTMMLFLSVSFTGIFLCLTMVVKYLNLLLVNQQSLERVSTTKNRI